MYNRTILSLHSTSDSTSGVLSLYLSLSPVCQCHAHFLPLSSAGLDFDSSSQSLLFTSNSSQTCASFMIIDDVILEGVELFDVSLSTEDPAVLFGLSSVVVEIEDNDHVTVGVIEESYTVAEGGSVEVCIRLTGATERVVTVTMATEGVSATGECKIHTYSFPSTPFPPHCYTLHGVTSLSFNCRTLTLKYVHTHTLPHSILSWDGL